MRALCVPCPCPVCPHGRSIVTRPHLTAPRELLISAKCVLFDFDGPLCRLFPGGTGADVAGRMARRLAESGGDPSVVVEPVTNGDPLGVLVAAWERYPFDRALLTALDDLLTAEEEALASEAAVPTEGACELAKALHGAGVELAVTTNNSRRAVVAYLSRRNLLSCFAGRIYGRTADPARLKPHPDCLHRALEQTGVAAGEALMIGDSAADRIAATAAGVPFLGYAENAVKYQELRKAGPLVSVSTLTGLLPRQVY
ncbi:HAD family hydrolase [Streptomyces sp. bgisy091]|uniref:HAD family hydrolase n=1 Tax=Streptomyces sp. bgisy091 TaxID=3413778 RepID=UPI003D73CD3F